MRTPAVSSKVIATLPVLLSTGTVSAFIYLDPRFTHWFSPLILGIISGGLVDLDNGLGGKVKNILFTLSAFAVASVSVQQTLHNPVWLAATLTALAFFFTLIGVAGLRYRTIAFGTLAVAIYTALISQAHIDERWYVNPALITGGALLYSGATVLTHILFPHRPVQENTAAAYEALSGYLAAKADFFDPDEAEHLEPQQIKLAMGNSQVINAFNLCRHSLFYRMRGQHRHPRTTRMLRYYFVAQDIHERISSSHVHYQAFAEQLRHSDLIYRIQRLLRLQAQACSEFAAALRDDSTYSYAAKLDRATKGAEQSLKHYAEHADSRHIAPYRVQRLLDNIIHVSLQFSHLGRTDNETLGEGDRIRLSSPESGGIKGAWRMLKGQITPQSPVFRHAVRMAVTVLAACALLQFSPAINAYLLPENVEDHLNLGFWILLTGIFVCQPNYSATKKRLVQRIIGTVAGVAVGSLLPLLNPTMEIKLAVVIITTMLFFYFRTNKHSFSTFFITIQAIIGFSVMGYDVTVFLLPRIADTVVGALIAGAAVYWIWPDWKFLSLEKTGAQAVQANAGYLKAILNELQQYGLRDDITYRHARRLSHDRAAALSTTLSDMSGEPKKYGSRLQDAFLLLKINYSLISYISALGAYRNKMHGSLCEAEETFLQRFFPVAEQLVDAMSHIGTWDAEQFGEAQRHIQNGLADLREALSENEQQDDWQSQVLWQQLTMIAEVLPPYYDALHREIRAAEDAEDTGQTSTTQNNEPDTVPT
ncbi:YccS family putative transporter [Conchiformibius steedae]|uniref:YccS family putative transporter n=1 Tax=Conchiformibius steedae TaxID=153493 RepID=UPI0026F04E35|nr:YccS family putative transporter [Conchiformibius steedae]